MKIIILFTIACICLNSPSQESVQYVPKLHQQSSPQWKDMMTSNSAPLHPQQMNLSGFFDKNTDMNQSSSADNGAPSTGADIGPITIMGDSIPAKETNIMHVAFPASKASVRNFRGELESNIEFRPTPNKKIRLRDLLFSPTTSKFNNTSPFPMPRGFEQPLIMRNGDYLPRTAIRLEDQVSSPINVEAQSVPSPMPIQEVPTIRKDGKEFRVVDPLDTYGVNQNGIFNQKNTHTAMNDKDSSKVAGSVPTGVLTNGAKGLQVRTQGRFPLPSPTQKQEINANVIPYSKFSEKEEPKHNFRQKAKAKHTDDQRQNESDQTENMFL